MKEAKQVHQLGAAPAINSVNNSIIWCFDWTSTDWDFGLCCAHVIFNYDSAWNNRPADIDQVLCGYFSASSSIRWKQPRQDVPTFCRLIAINSQSRRRKHPHRKSLNLIDFVQVLLLPFCAANNEVNIGIMKAFYCIVERVTMKREHVAFVTLLCSTNFSTKHF